MVWKPDWAKGLASEMAPLAIGKRPRFLNPWTLFIKPTECPYNMAAASPEQVIPERARGKLQCLLNDLA